MFIAGLPMKTALDREESHPAPDADLLRWQQAILQGNRAFEYERYGHAIGYYDDALTQASAMFGHCEDADAGTAAWIISHHNLADTYARLGRLTDQRRHLCEAHERMCAAVDDESLPPAWRQAAMRHSQRTYAELLLFLRIHPDDGFARRASQSAMAPVSRQLLH